MMLLAWFTCQTWRWRQYITSRHGWTLNRACSHFYSTYLLYGAEYCSRDHQLCSHLRVSQCFMEPKHSLPHSQELSTCPCPEPDQSSPVCFCMIHLNIIHPPRSWTSEWSLPLWPYHPLFLQYIANAEIWSPVVCMHKRVGQDSSSSCTGTSKIYCACSSCSTLYQFYTSDEMQNFTYGGVMIVPWFHEVPWSNDQCDKILNKLLPHNHTGYVWLILPF
jgi:hypothetical protein